MKVVTVYLILYFIFFVITAGIKMPVGIFIPSLLVGATWGRLFGLTVLQIFPNFVSKLHS